MKAFLIKYSILIVITSSLISCDKLFMDDAPSEKPNETFEYLWKEVDQHYSFFDYKKVDWDSIYHIYKNQVNNSMSEYQLFDVLFDMLCELKDGHVNLISPFNVSRYEFDLNAPNNYNERIIKENYISSKYYVTGPFIHDYAKNNNIGYIRYNSFSGTVSQYDMDFILARFSKTDGLILDLRQNGGGSITNVFKILEHFVRTKTEIYHSYIKKGPEHDNFSEVQKAYVKPNAQYYYTNKPIIVLIDRGSFSATSFFSLACKAIPNITLIGDTTGGGLGAPSGGQLPNGWTYRFSVSKTLSLKNENFENGVPPDIFSQLNETDVLLGKDAVIDKAIETIELLQ